MARSKYKRKKIVMHNNVDGIYRSSMNVNLSYISNSEHSSIKSTSIQSNNDKSEKLINNNLIVDKYRINKSDLKIVTNYSSKTNSSSIDKNSSCFFVHSKELSEIQKNSIVNIKVKEQLNKSCMQLKDAIINKTKTLFDKENEFTIKTSEVLSSANNTIVKNSKRSPNIISSIGKNDQIIILGDGRKQNPIEVNYMLTSNKNKKHVISTEKANEDCMLYNNSIVSTPKKSTAELNIKENEFCKNFSLRIPVIRLFNNCNDSKNIIFQINKNNVNNTNKTSNRLRCTSPILSQGIRLSRVSCLSLKNKSMQNSSQSLPSKIIKERVSNRTMLSCSSLIDKEITISNENEKIKAYKTVAIDERDEINNVNTVCLESYDNISKSVEISNNFNSSHMEMTTIASHVPVVRRQLEYACQSLLLDKVSNCEKIQNFSFSLQEPIVLDRIAHENSNRTTDNLESVEEMNNGEINKNISMRVNTSMDQIKLINSVLQKKKKILNKCYKKILKDNIVNQQPDTHFTINSIQACNLVDYTKRLLVADIIDDDYQRSNTIIYLKSRTNINQEKQHSNEIIFRQPSTSSVRSSMQVNTSLDSIRKSPIIKNKLDFKNILLTINETVPNSNQSKMNVHISKDQSLDDNSDLETIPLVERIKNISKINRCDTKKLKSAVGKPIERLSKSVETNNITSITNDSNLIDATPYPISRSILYKTIIKNAVNTLDPQWLIETSNNEELNLFLNKNEKILAKMTVINSDSAEITVLDSSEETSKQFNERKKAVMIDESLNEVQNYDNKRFGERYDCKQKDIKVMGKRKLYTLQDQFQLISFTPTDIKELSKPKKLQNTVKKNRNVKKKKQSKLMQKRQKSINESELFENLIISENVEKKKKKPRKILSKKMIIKKETNLTVLERMMCNGAKTSQRLSDKNSLKEFNLNRCHKKKNCKNYKMIIVVTGLLKQERNLVKSVIRNLGSATLEVNVTARTTHIISSGIRTINLLKGIVRGCWLLSLEWITKSLENEKWLDPSPYEMSHFSQTAQENRRDRQLFGKAYAPELFLTCGFIYIENGTVPSASSLKDLVKIAGGRITEDPNRADIIIGLEGLREVWILDSITTGEVQCLKQYKRK